MSGASKRFTARFHCNAAGTEPVRDWLRGMERLDRMAIGVDIKTVEYGWPIGMPVCRPMSQGLLEVRTRLKDRTARVLFCIRAGKMILLHGFIKKSQNTPQGDLDLAVARKREVERQR